MTYLSTKWCILTMRRIVFYRDTDGEWTPEKGELVYLDFKPKVPAQGNNTVTYTVKYAK